MLRVKYRKALDSYASACKTPGIPGPRLDPGITRVTFTRLEIPNI